jgi:nucleotidyltransferase/DNA polymerase involved in DNA repair
MQRILAATFPHLALLTALDRHPELRGEPVVVGGAPELRLPVVAASAAATAAGVRAGQPLRQAQQLCPAAAFVALDPRATARRRDELTTGLLEVVPRVELEDVALVADLSGRHAAYRDEAAWAAAVARRLSRLLDSDEVRIGVAGSRQVAAIAARVAEPRHIRRIPPGAEAGFLAPLPLQHLELDGAVAGRLAAMGLDRIGTVAALAAADLQRQFGPVGLELWRAARGEGGPTLARPPLPRRIAERLVLEGGTADLESLRFAVHRLAVEVGERLRDAGLLGERVELTCELEAAEPLRRCLVPVQPLGAPAELWEAAAELLGGLALDLPVTAIRLEAEGLRPGPGRQVDLWRGGDATQEAVAQMASRLRRRFGAEAVRQVALATDPGDLPERRFRWIETAVVEEPSPPRATRPRPGSPERAPIPSLPSAMPAVRW